MIDLRNCEFGFKCTANWDEMKRTSALFHFFIST
jgi:hypothetical protein